MRGAGRGGHSPWGGGWYDTILARDVTLQDGISLYLGTDQDVEFQFDGSNFKVVVDEFRIWHPDEGPSDYIQASHDGTNANVVAGSGNLNLNAGSGTLNFYASSGSTFKMNNVALYPFVNGTHDLGTTTSHMRALYLYQSTSSGLYLGGAQEGRLFYDSTNTRTEFSSSNPIRLDAETQFQTDNGATVAIKKISEAITIAVGSGSLGVASLTNLLPADSIILSVSARVTQAPGGGATAWELGETGSGNVDDILDNIAVALGTTANNIANSDGTYSGPFFNGAANTVTVTTDLDVTLSDMIVRIVVHYIVVTEPTS